MKILLANPPWRKGDLYGVRSGCRFPYMTDELTRDGVPTYIPFPFTLAQAAALLKKHGFEAEFWDEIAAGGSPESFYERVTNFRPDLYLQEVVAPSYPNDRHIFETLKSRLPAAVLGAAGIMVTGWGPEMLEKNPAIDLGLTYEWEETALDVAHRLKNGDSLAGTRGLYHRQNGKVVAEARRMRPALADLPWPDRESLPMLRYNDDFAFLPVPNLQMYTSRGCPYQCSFCVWINARYGDLKVQWRDPQDVMDEIKWCLARWPFKAVYFDDDTFNLKKSYILELCEKWRQANISVPWAAMCRADLFDRETLEECKRSGLYAVKYGIESADQKILAGIHKNLDLEKARQVIAWTQELGIKVHLTLVIGLPGETEATIRKTWRFARQLKPDYMQFSLATPYPGTELYQQAKEHGWIEAQDWSDFNADSQAAMRTDSMSRPELEKWVRTLNFRRFGLQLFRNPGPCFRMYLRKAMNSPRKIINFTRNFFKR